MSLPACQQRVLDRIGASLQATEPRLAGMFAIFTRLCKGEAPPLREQLKAQAAPIAWLTGLIWSAGHARTARARHWGRVLVVSQVAIAFALIAVLIGSFTRAPSCASQRMSRGSAVTAARGQACPSQAGLASEWSGK